MSGIFLNVEKLLQIKRMQPISRNKLGYISSEQNFEPYFDIVSLVLNVGLLRTSLPGYLFFVFAVAFFHSEGFSFLYYIDEQGDFACIG